MRGHEALILARLNSRSIGGVDVLVGGDPGYYRHGKAWWFDLAVEVGEVAPDFRALHGLPVFVHADSYEVGYPFFERAAEFEPLLVALVAPEVLVRFDGERIEEWAM